MIRAAGRLCLLKELAKGRCQLIRAAGGLGAATDADELIPHLSSLLALHECTDTLQVAVKIADGELPGTLYPEKTEKSTTIIFQQDAEKMLELLYGEF